jgi:hypothetical protein
MYNKFVKNNGEIFLDLSDDNITPEVLLEGYTAHDRTGAAIVGTMTQGTAQATIQRKIFCPVLGHSEGQTPNYTSVSEYAGFNYSDWYPYILKFSVPHFSGQALSAKVTFSMTATRINGNYTSTISYRWALCSSDSNIAMYTKTKDDITEANQLEKGIATFTGLNSTGVGKVSMELPADKFSADTTYYLILWGDGGLNNSQSFTTMQPPGNHSVELTYETEIAAGDGVISVNVEAGSTVTCTNGAFTYEQESNGTVLFSGLCTGTWTITAVKDGKRSVHIVELQYPEITMAYELTLYDLADNTIATGGWDRITYAGNYNLTESAYHGIINIRGQNGGTGVYVTKKAIDVTGFTKLLYKCSKGGEGVAKVVFMPAEATSVDEAALSTEIAVWTDNPTTLEELDITELTGQYHVGISVTPTSTSTIINAYMAYMHLE